MNRYFTGIGSRESLKYPEVHAKASTIACILEHKGFTLRSGCAPGMDSAFQDGVQINAEIWLPWKSFAKEQQAKHPSHTYKVISKTDKEAYDSVFQFHPGAKFLKPPVILLHSRNYRQCIGINAPNSEFLICWTPGGKKQGGTATAWSVAEHYNIPVFNLFDWSVDSILKKLRL